MEGHCLQAMKILDHHANGGLDWAISGHHSVNASREAISILYSRYKRFTFVHPVRFHLSKSKALATRAILLLILTTQHFLFVLQRLLNNNIAGVAKGRFCDNVAEYSSN